MNALSERPETADAEAPPQDGPRTRIERAIIHILDNKEAAEPVLSAAELSLDDERLRGFFGRHLDNVLGDSAIAQASFGAGPAGIAAAARCYGILEDPGSFIAFSGELAQTLWDVTRSHRARKRIQAGSLVVCLCRADGHPAPLLALLKIDKTSTLVPRVTRRNRETVVEATVAENAMPTTGERLQKAAVVMPRGTAERYDLLLLDRLTSGAPAEFFSRSFLGTEPILTDEQRTSHFYIAAARALKRLTQETPLLPPEKAEGLRQAVHQALDGNHLDARQWVANLKLPIAAKKVLTFEIEKQLDTQEFEIDPGFVAKRFETRKFRGSPSSGIVVEFDAAVEGKGKLVQIGETFQRGPDRITRVVLEVPNLEWIKP